MIAPAPRAAWLAGAWLGFGALTYAAPAWLPVFGLWPLVCAFLFALDWWLLPRPEDLRLTRNLPPRLGLRSPAEVTWTVESRAAVTVRLALADDAPPVLAAAPDTLHATLAPGTTATLAYRVTPTARGPVALGAVWLRYAGPLGLLARTERRDAPGDTRVLPWLPARGHDAMWLEPARRREVGERIVRERGVAQEFAALRDHHPDDDWRLVDWKATARRNRLTVRTYEAERSQAVLLCVDTGRLMGATVGGVTKLDLACDAALRLAAHALGHGDRVGCLAFSDRVHAECPPRKGRDHLARCADLLSDARADLAETSLVRCVQHLERRHRKRALLIVCTDVLDTGLAEDVLAPLAVVARRHRVLLVGIRDREIGAFAAAPPTDLDAICRQAVAQEMLRERRAALERLRRAGVATLDCDAETIGPPLLARYLALTGRRAA